MKNIIVFLVVIAAFCKANKPVPSYIKTCSRNDPAIEECFANSANLAMSHIAKGDQNYNIKTLLPLNFADLIIVDLPPLKLMLLEVIVYGVENMTISEPILDFESNLIQFTFTNPEIIWRSKYVAVVEENGMSIETEGHAEIFFRQGKYGMLFEYELQNIGGQEYANITKYNADFLNVDMDFKLDNLGTNPIIQREFEKVKKNFNNAEIPRVCGETVARYFSRILSVVPFNKIFPEK